MQSIIVHKLKFHDGKWEVTVAPHSKRMPSRFLKYDLIINRDSKPSAVHSVLRESYAYVDLPLHEDVVTTISTHAVANKPENLRLIATLMGGFWYRFAHHEERMSTYVKMSQYLVILEGEGCVVAAIGDVGTPIDYSVLNTIDTQPVGTGIGNVAQLIVNHGGRRDAIRELQSLTKGAKRVSVIDPYILGTITGKCEVNEQYVTLIERKISNELVLEKIREILGRSFGSIDKFISYVERKALPSDKDLKAIRKVAESLFVKDCYVSDFMKAVNNKGPSELNIFYSSSHANTKKVKDEIKERFSGRVRFCDLDDFEDIFVHDRVWIIDSSEAVVVGNSFGGLGMNAVSFILPLPPDDLESLKAVMKVTGIEI